MEPNFLVDLVTMSSGRTGSRGGKSRPGQRPVGKEQRKNPRVPVRQMRLRLPIGPRLVTGNVSVTGVGFETEDPIEIAVGERFGVQLAVPDCHEPLDLHAELRHLQYIQPAGRYFGGGRFVDVDELLEYPLFRYIEEASLALLASASVP